MTPIEYAVDYIGHGWLPIPLAAAGTTIKRQDGTVEIADGKRPARKYVHLNDCHPPFNVDALVSYWDLWPKSGVGILLKPSGLLVVDCDSQAAVVEAMERCPEPCNNIARTRKGAHLVYRRPDDCPAHRAIHRGDCGQIDVLTDGYIVAPPTKRADGFQYRWLKRGPLQLAPEWASGLIMALRQREIQTNGSISPENILDAPEIDLVSLEMRHPNIWAAMTQNDTIEDRSALLWLTMNCLMRFHLIPVDDPTYPNLVYSDASIARAIWYAPGAIKNKPRERGWEWFCNEIARARTEILPG